LLAWFLLAWLLRDPIYLAYDYLRHPVFELTTAQPPDFGMIWERLRYFVMIAAGLIAWLYVCGVIDRRRLKPATRSPQPAALTVGEQAARVGIGIGEKTVNEARKFKVTSIRINEDGSIAGFEEVVRELAAGRLATKETIIEAGVPAPSPNPPNSA